MSVTTQSVHAPAPRAPTVVAFTLRALAWLPVAFAVWYFAAPVLLFPVVLLVRGIAWLGFADLVRGIEQSAAIATFVTALRPGEIDPRGVLTVDVNLLLYAFGMPLFAGADVRRARSDMAAPSRSRLRRDGAVRRVGRARRFPEERCDHRRTRGGCADRILGVATRGDRLRVPVRLADPARGCACGAMGGHARTLRRRAASSRANVAAA